MVVGHDFKKYIAKNSKGQEPPLTLINETLANFLLNNWSLPVPGFTFIEISRELLNSEELSQYHKHIYYDIPAFGSAYLEPFIDLNDFVFPLGKVFYNKIHNPIDFFRITLFDTWIENDDRKPTNYNLIFSVSNDKFTIVPIDHAYVFSTLNYIDLNPDEFFPSANEHLLVSDFVSMMKKHTKIDEAFIRNEKQYFYLCINKCEQSIDDFFTHLHNFTKISDESVSKIKEFLFNNNRNKKVFDEYIYRLKQ